MVFFAKNDASRTRPSSTSRGLQGTPEVFIDPNACADGTVRVGLLGPWLIENIWPLRRSGSDWSEIRVMDIAGKKELSPTGSVEQVFRAAWWKTASSTAAMTTPPPARS